MEVLPDDVEECVPLRLLKACYSRTGLELTGDDATSARYVYRCSLPGCRYALEVASTDERVVRKKRSEFGATQTRLFSPTTRLPISSVDACDAGVPFWISRCELFDEAKTCRCTQCKSCIRVPRFSSHILSRGTAKGCVGRCGGKGGSWGLASVLRIPHENCGSKCCTSVQHSDCASIVLFSLPQRVVAI